MSQDDAPPAAAPARVQNHAPGTHACPLYRCHVRLPQHVFMCRKHWRRVPSNLQAEVTRTYRRDQTGLTSSPEWRAAAAAAVDAVRATERPR